MFSRIVAAVLWALCILFPASAMAGEGTPAGYVVSLKLAGADAARKTGVARKGEEIAVKLMMPVFAGDTVFVRDSQSRIGLDLGKGSTIEVGGTMTRYAVAGELDTGDGAWSLISAIGDALGGGDAETAPDNMVAKGDDGALAVPMANRGSNFVVRGEKPLWLGWTGGVAPFRLEMEGRGTPIETKAREIGLPWPESSDGRMAVTIIDASGHRVSFRLRLADALPNLPAELMQSSDGAAFRLALAAWLTKQDDGAWKIAAAQLLSGEEGTATALLRDAIHRGWALE